MKILFDNNVPLYVSPVFKDHEVRTAYRMGWAALQNGRLLEAAETGGFQLLLTLDRGFRHQQRLDHRTLAVAILMASDQSRESILDAAGRLLERLDEALPGEILVVD